ncbi:MAG: NAD(P)-dependent oxidoreductase [Firmicutes bacterium]|nr:NAD(P)-dependent oxidoreductase [Bacillota bacterium]
MSFRDSHVYQNDINSVLADSNINWEELDGKRILITGASGLIGGLIVSCIVSGKERGIFDCEIYALARSEEKVRNLFGEDYDCVKWIFSDVENATLDDINVDYIIHAASATSSKGFIEKPVEVLRTGILGTMNLLEYARSHDLRRFLYLSTMEVYGAHQGDDKVTEDTPTFANPYVVRDCYPISKITAENMCISYGAEYRVPVTIARLTQTFGPGVSYGDGRVFAEFARCAIEKRNIVLHTEGKTRRNYLYTADAARALFTLLLDDDADEKIYNVANEDTYCSIKEMAELVSGTYGGNIDFDLSQDISAFAPTLNMNLSSEKLRSLGWKADVDLRTMFENLIEYMRGNNG